MIRIGSEGSKVYTENLAEWSLPEVTTVVEDPSSVPDAEDLLRYLAKYMVREDVQVKPGETIARGYWTVQVRAESSDELSLWEYNAQSTGMVPGVDLTLRHWREQNEVCDRYGAEFSPPSPNQLVVLSDGVSEGVPVGGVRYPSPDHMSGWWITTDLYDGNIKSLVTEHLYHLTSERPDLTRYLALPFGYRFDERTDEAWFDEKAAT